MGWYQIPDFDSAESSLDDNPFASSRAQPTWKVSIKLPVDDWLCRKLEKLNLTISEGYPSRNAKTAGLLRDQFVKTPRSSRWYDMHTVKKDSGKSTVCSWSPEQCLQQGCQTQLAFCPGLLGNHPGHFKALGEVSQRTHCHV